MKLTHLALAPIATIAVATTLAARELTMVLQPAQAAQVSVEAVVARNVVLWMRVTGANGQVLHHVWFWGDTELGNVPLNVGGSPWRAWSRKVVMPEMTGPGHVEIRDASDKVLKRIDFTVGS